MKMLLLFCKVLVAFVHRSAAFRGMSVVENVCFLVCENAWLSCVCMLDGGGNRKGCIGWSSFSSILSKDKNTCHVHVLSKVERAEFCKIVERTGLTARFALAAGDSAGALQRECAWEPVVAS